MTIDNPGLPQDDEAITSTQATPSSPDASSVQTRPAGNGETSQEAGDSDSDRQQKYDKFMGDIHTTVSQAEVLGNIDVEGSFAGSFAEYVEANNPEALDKIKEYVDKSRDTFSLSQAERDSVGKLAKFLDDISNPERMKKDFDEFMEKIKTPKKLNTMTKAEIRRVEIYLGRTKTEGIVDQAWEAYSQMRNIKDKYDENGMKKQDKEFFERIWTVLEQNYSNNDVFVGNEYPAFKTLDSTSAKLKEFAGESWTGGPITAENIPDAGNNSFVNKQKVVSKFNQLNESRINANKQKVGAITVDYSNEKSKFTKDNSELKYDGQTFTVDKMMEVFGNQIGTKADEGTDFVGDEKNTTIEELKQTIFDNLNNTILADTTINTAPQTQTNTPTNTPTNSPETQGEGSAILTVNTSDVVKIKDQKLIDKIKSDLKFCESLDGAEVKFDMNAVKEYLQTLKDKPWKDFKALTGVEKETWAIAVQIALTYLNTQEGGKFKDKCNVTWIDGIRKSRTIAGVKGFQESWNEVHKVEISSGSLKKLNVDGAPGQYTITALLGELNLESTGTTESGSINQFTVGAPLPTPDSLVNIPSGCTAKFADENAANAAFNTVGQKNIDIEIKDADGKTTTQTVTVEIVAGATTPSLQNLLDSFSGSELDLSSITTLNEAGAQSIVDKLNDLSGNMTVDLSKLENIDGTVASKLSGIKGSIKIDKILDNTNSQLENDLYGGLADILKKLAPATGNLVIKADKSIVDIVKHADTNNEIRIEA